MLEIYLVMLCGGDSNVEVDHEHYDFQRGNLSAHTMPHNPYCHPASSIREDVPRTVKEGEV